MYYVCASENNRMKRIYLIATIFLIGLAGCKKDDPKCPEVSVTAPAAEVQTLKAYIQANNITATEDPRGFFYTIDSLGSGSKPTACSAVSVDYVGKLTNGTVFDSGDDVSFYLSELILGWQEGIPLVAPGGKITLYLPPSLAYGPNANGSIPANSNLIFNITLNKVY